MFFNTAADELEWYKNGDFSNCYIKVYKDKGDKFLVMLMRTTKSPFHSIFMYSPEEVISYGTKVCSLQPHMYVDLRVDRGKTEKEFTTIFSGLKARIREVRWTYKKKPRQPVLLR